MTKITLSGGTTIELSAEQLRELGAKIAEAVEGKAEEAPLKEGDYVVFNNRAFFTNDEKYRVHVDRYGDLFVIDDDGDERYAVLREKMYCEVHRHTAEEVAEYEKARIFTENGRKPNEYREGDIVIYVGGASTYGLPVEVYKDTEDGLTAIKWHDTVGLGVCSEMHDAITPLVFVEQRLDRKQ